jgi:AraC-like DNA-binding protein
MLIARPPRHPLLRPWVQQLWAMDAAAAVASGREHVLPTGWMHIAVRLAGPPLRTFDDGGDLVGTRHAHAVVGGMRGAFYARETGGSGPSVGVQLHPAAALALLGAPAAALAHGHTALGDLWGPDARHCMEELDAAAGAPARLDALERWLVRKLRPAAASLHPAVVAALRSLRAGAPVRSAVAESGFSHRHLVTLFRDAMGLAPKEYARLQRLQAALALAGRPGLPWAEVALQAGYSDQPHFNREFRAFAGVTPQAWRLAAPRHAHHVPVAG